MNSGASVAARSVAAVSGGGVLKLSDSWQRADSKAATSSERAPVAVAVAVAMSAAEAEAVPVAVSAGDDDDS